MKNGELINEFIQNLKLAGGEILSEIPKGWYVTEAKFAVAENGAVWIEEYTKELFLSDYVAVKIPKNKIYPKMTEITGKIENPGIFVAGPSKTADVESFLVLGAHGAMKLGVLFI
jgi:L-lactate dehydrogenase complex protein LldG